MKNIDILSEIKKELQFVVQNMQQLSNSVGNIASAIEKLSQGGVSKDIKPNRAPVRKKIIVEDGEVKKRTRVPSTRIVQDIIWKSSQGVDAKTLMDKTGYDQRKIYNIVFQLKSQGKIQNVRHGVYGKASK
jgi:hypothetical protein